jgi:DNA-directed RNA polymerase specialized sigma subunit
MILAADAFKRYEPKAGAALTTFAHSHLRQLSRVRNERAFVRDIPASVHADARMLQRLRSEYEQQYGQEASFGWLKDNSGMSDKRLQKAMQVFAEVGEAKTMPGEAFQAGAVKDDGMRLWEDAVYADLDERGKKIYEWVSGYRGVKKLPKQEIARRLRISPAAVSSRLTTIQKQLGEYSETGWATGEEGEW